MTMMNLRTYLINDISEGVQRAKEAGVLAFEGEDILVQVKRTDDMLHGHYSSSIALQIASRMQVDPMSIAEAIVSHMPEREYIQTVEGAKPGFLNITLRDVYLASRIDDVSEEEIRFACNVGSGKSVNMEFISANPTGPLTIGNARTAFSAETLANVMEYAGYNVIREYYINDSGEQIRRLGESVLRRILMAQGHEVEFPEDLYQGEYILDIAKRIVEEYKETDGKTFAPDDLADEELLGVLSKKSMRMCLHAIQKTIADDLHISFDVWTSEQAIRDSGEIERVLDILREKQLMYKKDGAEFLKTTKFGDDKDRVMVKKNGAYAYIAPDLAYHQLKFDRKFDLLFTYLGADHQGHIPKLKAALTALGNDTEKLHMVVAQWLEIVREGKQVALSKRKGNVYSLKELIDEIGYDAARFFMVQHALHSHMVLDLDVAKEKSEANPVYYIQYAYVRLQSIIRKANEQRLAPSANEVPVTITHDSERELALRMFAFPEIIEDIASSFAVHQLSHVAYDFARAVNAFYRDVQVLHEENEELRNSRLQMVVSAHCVLGQIIDLLGIGKPDVM